MKKVTIGATVVLFLLVGFGYANAQQNNIITNMAGELTSLTLQITYEQELAPTLTQSEGQSLVTATSSIGRGLPADQQKSLGYKRQDNPVIYMWVDGNGNVSQINMTWRSPINPGTAKIWTVNCRGGNQTVGTTGTGTPGLGLSPTGPTPRTEDGMISTMPRETKAATARTDTVRGVLACSICPDGFPFDDSTSPPTIIANSNFSNTFTCNDGESYANGYLTFTGTFYYNLGPNGPTITSATITGTMGGGSFDYFGADWAATPCNVIDPNFECKGIFTGTFGAKLTACPGGDPFCWDEF